MLFLALDSLGIKPDKLYVSEVDKYAMIVADKLNPSNINLGDVKNIDVKKLEPIDLIVGGSPCTSFSFAGKRNGMSTSCEIKITSLEQYLELKNGDFEFEGQSYLFWEYMRILKDIQKYNPNVKFFLENVVMAKEWEIVLSNAIGIAPVMINSSRLSAQNRKRLYWSNIKTTTHGLFNEVIQDIEQPEDKGILLKDVLESEIDQEYYLSDKLIKGLSNPNNSFVGRFKPTDGDKKANCLTATMGKNQRTGNYIEKIDFVGCDYRTGEGFRDRKNGKTGTLTARAREDESCGQLVKETGCIKFGRTEEAKRIRRENNKKGVDYSPFAEKQINDVDYNKMNTLTTATNKDNLLMENNVRIRRLTPRECFRLQTVAEHHINTILSSGVSNSQLYKMCGNGWTIEVIAHFFKHLL